MKIAFVSDTAYPYLHGGKEKRLYEISTRLVKLGHEVHIYTMHWWDSPENARIENGVHLHAICKKYELYKGDRRTITEGIMFGLACFKMYKVDFDVIDVDHMPFFPVISSWISCKLLRGKKLYGIWHEVISRAEWTDYMGLGGNIAYLIEQVSIKLPDIITAASEHTQDLLKLKRSNVELVTSGIDYMAIQKVKPAAIKCDVLTVCRLVKDKNVKLLIDAVAILKKTNPEISCIIVGKGPEKPWLIRQVRRLKLSDNVTFIDHLPEAEDVYSYMKAAKVFCLPSTREGFGIVTLESLGCGTPVITIDSPSNNCRNFITDGKNGSVIKLEARAIAKSIDYWTAKSKKRDIAKGVSSYDWDVLAKKQAEVYAL
jgi:glycosyltransferase involved in cell wall biosynthesis